MTFLPQFNLPHMLLIAGGMSLTIAVGVTADASPLRPASNVPELAASPTLKKIQVYGQVPSPNQFQKGYVVFQKIENQVVGAYYQPRSEFSCFVGNIENRDLNVSFVSANGRILNRAHIPLSDLYRLETPGVTAQTVMQTCRQQLIQSL